MKLVKAVNMPENINLTALAKQAHLASLAKGFWQDLKPAEAIALMHSELSEALECLREGGCIAIQKYEVTVPKPEDIEDMGKRIIPKPIGVPSELADCIIRIMDFCGRYEIDIHKAVKEKMEYNETRPFKHGKKF